MTDLFAARRRVVVATLLVGGPLSPNVDDEALAASVAEDLRDSGWDVKGISITDVGPWTRDA